MSFSSVLRKTWGRAGGTAAAALLAAATGAAAAEGRWDAGSLPLPPIPDALGVAAPFAGVCDGALVVAGGANFPNGMPWDGGRKVWHDTVYALETPGGAWRTVGRLPAPRAYGVSLQLTNGLICAGGSDAEGVRADVWLLTMRRGRLRAEPLPPLPRPLANACGAVVDGIAYVAGGESEPQATQAVCGAWAMTVARPQLGWVPLPPWSGPGRILAAGAAADHAFFVIGGCAYRRGFDGRIEREYLRDGYRFDQRLGWTRIADAPHAVAAAPSPAPVAGEGLFILGSDDGSKYGYDPPSEHPGFARDVLAYDPTTDRWRAGGEVEAPSQVTVPAVPWQGRWVLPCGEIRPGVRTPAVRAY